MAGADSGAQRMGADAGVPRGAAFALLRWEWVWDGRLLGGGTGLGADGGKGAQPKGNTKGNAEGVDASAYVEKLRGGFGRLVARVDSQDSWMWRGPLPESVVQQSAFHLGE